MYRIRLILTSSSKELQRAGRIKSQFSNSSWKVGKRRLQLPGVLWAQGSFWPHSQELPYKHYFLPSCFLWLTELTWIPETLPSAISSGVLLLVVPPLENHKPTPCSALVQSPKWNSATSFTSHNSAPVTQQRPFKMGFLSSLFSQAGTEELFRNELVPTFFFPWGQGEPVRSCDRFEPLNKQLQVRAKPSPGCPSCHPRHSCPCCCPALSGQSGWAVPHQASVHPHFRRQFYTQVPCTALILL